MIDSRSKLTGVGPLFFVKKFLIFSLYLGGAGVLFLILGAIGLANLNLNLGGDKSEAESAKSKLGSVALECAAKIADGQINPTFIVPEVNGYKFKNKNNAGFYLGNNRKLSDASIHCSIAGEMKFVSENESKYPTFSYNFDTYEKKCFAKLGSEAEKYCPNGKW